MKFSAVVEQVLALLQRQKRVSYRALKREFDLDDDYIEDLKAEIVDARRLATDEDGKVLVWKDSLESSVQSPALEREEQAPSSQTLDPRLSNARPSVAERRQLTVMFCDLVGSTTLSEQLDPEDYHAVVQRYHQTGEAMIQRYEGFVPQHLGDGLLVYFGYPAAHEDDAQRAVRAALEIVEAVRSLSFPTIQLPRPLQVRIGIHTGLVVIGEIGGSEKREMLALGETPNLAARLQGLAAPDTVVISAATQHLVQGLFEYQALGTHVLKGLSTPVAVPKCCGRVKRTVALKPRCARG
jgi:class 3 adenylate cyclase